MKKYINYLLYLIAIILGLIIGYFLLTTVLKWFLPFIIAYAIAYITEPVISFLEVKVKLPRKIASAVTILATISLLGSVITLIVYRIIYEIKELTEQLPKLFNLLSQKGNELFDKGLNIYIELPVGMSQFIDNVINNITQNIMSLIKPVTEATTKFAYNFAKSMPSIIIFIIVLFLSAYFISSDKRKISDFLTKILPNSISDKLITLKNDLSLALLGLLKAQLILMSITFVELSIGFLIIGVEYAILLGLIISLIDALPILGTGTILIPWAIFSLIAGNLSMGLSLIVLYGIAMLVRQLLEPKIVGRQLGIYPLITLMAMYIGLKTFGVIGMFLGPIIVLIIKNIYKSGLIKFPNSL